MLQNKCEQYWPSTVEQPVCYGDIHVELKSETTLGFYVVRVMDVKLVSFHVGFSISVFEIDIL